MSLLRHVRLLRQIRYTPSPTEIMYTFLYPHSPVFDCCFSIYYLVAMLAAPSYLVSVVLTVFVLIN